ncbi:MAG: phosphoribosylglycinamide formyltransferase [Firmicutes bacterium]|jgi:phosphoribosylglycinamide formyltransferase-1|nr:phosphoribosylglycinamide formyltransferase [Bacillota bacterium]
MKKINICVFISGGGTNLENIIDKCHSGFINGEVKLLVSDKKEAYGLERAKNHNIKSYVHEKGADGKRDVEKLLEAMDESEIDLVILAGYLSIVEKNVINKYRNKIINIHPSLIPSFCGKGFYGMKVHEAAIKRGVKISGATVHYVDEGTDTGPIVMQKTVEVDEDDTAESLQKKVLNIEYEILGKVARLISLEKIYVEDGTVRRRRD